MRALIRWLLIRLGFRPPAAPPDPHAWQPARLKPRPGSRGGAVAVAEPDDNDR
jgi:hypothetical protein